MNVLRTRNRRTGLIDNRTPQHIFDHPILGADLEIIGEEEKPFVPELLTEKSVEAGRSADKTEPEDADDKSRVFGAHPTAPQGKDK